MGEAPSADLTPLETDVCQKHLAEIGRRRKVQNRARRAAIRRQIQHVQNHPHTSVQASRGNLTAAGTLGPIPIAESLDDDQEDFQLMRQCTLNDSDHPTEPAYTARQCDIQLSALFQSDEA